MRPQNVIAPLDPGVAKDGLKLKVQVYIFGSDRSSRRGDLVRVFVALFI